MPHLQAVLQLSVKNRGIKLIRIKPQLDVLGQLGTSDLHPPVFPRLLVGNFVDAVVVKVPHFPSPVTPADPGFRETVVIVMTMSHKNKTSRTDHHHRNDVSLYSKPISDPKVDRESNDPMNAMKSIP